MKINLESVICALIKRIVVIKKQDLVKKNVVHNLPSFHKVSWETLMTCSKTCLILFAMILVIHLKMVL